jgi:hypothetical protein
MELKETGCEDADWINEPEDRLKWWALGNGVVNVHVS